MAEANSASSNGRCAPERSRSRSRSPESQNDLQRAFPSAGTSRSSRSGVSDMRSVQAPSGSSQSKNIVFDSLSLSNDGFEKRITADQYMLREVEYEIRGKIGEGSFGVVMEGYDLSQQRSVAIKIIKQQRVKFVKREIYILGLLAGKPNIVELLDVLHDPLTDVPSFVFDYIRTDHWSQIYPSLTLGGIKSYAYQLLNALHHCRNSGILHRDIKPANILYDSILHKLVLIDWGTADIWHPDKNSVYLVGTREFRSPELLMQCVRYDFSVDMWSAGCVIGQIILGRDPLFGTSETNDKQLLRFVERYGEESMKSCLLEGLDKIRDTGTWKAAMDALSSLGSSPPKEWRSLGAKSCRQRIRDCEQHGLLTLLDNILQLNPSARLLPADAMRHSFFANSSIVP